MSRLEARVKSSLIAAEFRAVVGTGKVRPKTNLYGLIEKECGVQPSNARKIVEGYARTGPKSMYDALIRLNERLSHEDSVPDSITKLVREIEFLGIFANRSVFAEYVKKKIKLKHPDSRSNLRDSLFYHKLKFTTPWHYDLIDLLQKIKSGKVEVDRKYLRWDFPTYRAMLKFTYFSLRRDYGMARDQALGELSSLLGLSPKTLLSHHMYGKTPIQGSLTRLTEFQDKLIGYIKSKILITIDMREQGLNQLGHLMQEVLSGSQQGHNVLIIAPTEYSHGNRIPAEIRATGMQLRASGYQVRFVLNPKDIEKAILAFQ